MSVYRSEDIVLIVEDISFKCNKSELSKHSDYFKAMFEGNFIEKSQHSIRLKEVDAKSFKIIITLLWDSTYVINEDDILLVLEAACMLQFSNVKQICIDRIREILTPSNCIKVWFATEKFEIEDLHLKAKYLSLIEFDEIKEMDCLMELNLEQLYIYLADVRLQCRSEFDIFIVCMKWWYENSSNNEKLLHNLHSKENKTKNLLYLLATLNYRKLSEGDLKEMLSYPEISTNQYIKDLLNYLVSLKSGQEVYLFSELRNIVSNLLSCRDRAQMWVPCFLVQSVNDENSVPSKRLKITSADMAVIYHDQFKRKRYYKVINNHSNFQEIIYFDISSNKFKKLMEVDQTKCDKLDGFKIKCYKEFIFLFGGEYKIGRGDWNRSFWAYDHVKTRWERKSVIPQVRRHFESCIVGEYLFIIGGAGNYRIIQDNMLWYNYKNDMWSKVIMLPCPGRQTKCCPFKDKLFLLNVDNKCGYFFDTETSKWIQLNIIENDDIPAFFNKFVIFSYEDRLFFKGSNLIEMKLESYTLRTVSSRTLTTSNYDSIDAVVCNDVVYSVYRRKPDDGNTRISFEKLYLKNYKTEFIFEDTEEDFELKTDQGKFKIGSLSSIFAFQHWKLVKGNSFVNNLAADLFNR